MEILCSFRLVLEGKTGIEIPEWSRLEFLEKILANTFALSDAEVTAPLNRGGISDLPLLRRLLSTLPEVLRAKFLGTDGHFCFTSMHVWQLQEPSLSEPYFRFRRFILLLQLEKKISMSKWHSEVWPDTYDEGYIHQFQPELAHKIPYQQWKHLV